MLSTQYKSQKEYMPKTPAKKARKAATPKTAPMVAAAPMRAEVNSAYSFSNFVAFLNTNFSLILLVGIFFVLGFIVGSLWTENQLNKGGLAAGGTAPTAQQPTAPDGP